MTKRLFDDRPYDKDFQAVVKNCIRKKDKYAIVLDQTLFFPEQGGQTSDIGILDGKEILDVQIEDGVICHYCQEEIEVGKEVSGCIDWKHRFNNMQQHTGEHIFTGLAHNEYGAENVGFHLSDNTVTLDLDIELNDEMIRHIEVLSNEVIARDVSVKAWYPNEEEIKGISYRSKIEIANDIRIVEIEGVDKCACCAPHVSSTGQVGILKVLSYGKYKGGSRVYILCGLRALVEFNKKQELLTATYQQLNCAEEDIPLKVKSLMEENKGLRYKITEFKSKQLLEKIQQYPSELKDVLIFSEDLDAKVMREGVNKLVENHDGLCAIFSGDDDNGYNFIIGSRTRDCNAIAAGLRELLSAKGGGSKVMCQGSVNATRNDIERTLI